MAGQNTMAPRRGRYRRHPATRQPQLDAVFQSVPVPVLLQANVSDQTDELPQERPGQCHRNDRQANAADRSQHDRMPVGELQSRLTPLAIHRD